MLEICIDSVQGALAARSGGANRVELCAALIEGGITPSHGMIRSVRDAAPNLPVMVMVRPRGGDFCYNEQELQVMVADIRACAELGAAGVVVGALRPDGTIDSDATDRLLQAARSQGLDVTFHRAFDMSSNLQESLDTLIALGIPRVLSSGGQLTAVQGLPVLQQLVDRAAGRISIMAGSGVNATNVGLFTAVGIRELHSTAKGSYDSPMLFRPPGMTMCSPNPPEDWRWQVTDAAAVAALAAAVSSAKQHQQPQKGIS